MICVAALCRTSSSPLLKLNTAMTYKIGTKALSAILDAMKLIRSPPVDSCSEYDPNDSFSKLPHRETTWNCISLGAVIHHEWATNIVCNEAEPQEYASSSVL